MRTLSLSLWLAASLCTAQTLELGDVAFLGAHAFPEAASVQVGPEGQVLVAGSAAQPGLPIALGSGRAYSPDDCGDRGVFVPCRDGYAALLEPGGEIRFATYFGGSREDRIVDAGFDPAGDVWLLVTSTSPDYLFDIDLAGDGPSGLNRLLMRLDGDSGLVLSTTRLPPGSETLSVGPNGGLFVAGHARPGMAEIGGLGLDIGIGGTFRSDDGGATWTTANGGLESPLVNVTAWRDGQGGTLLVGTALQDVSLSQDRGVSWRRFTSPEGSALVSAAAVGGVAPQILASTQTGLFARREDEPAWHRVLNERVDWIAPAPSDPTQVYAWGESGVSRSSNSGEGFQPTGWTEPASPLESGGIAVDPADPNTVYLTSFNRDSLEASLIRSADGGQTWTRTTIGTSLDLYDPGPFIRPPLALAVGPGSTLYAALPGGLLRSLDGGATWQAVDQEFRDQLAQGSLLVRQVFANGPVLQALTNVGLFRSTNGGNS